MRPGIFLFAFLAISASLTAQSPQQPGSVSGKVINQVTGQGIKKAVVTLRGSNPQNSYVTGSDASGKFQFDNVPPDKYTATAEAEGYAGNALRGRKLIPVAAQQEVSDAEVPLAPLSVITGKVVDDSGQPIEGASVAALRYVYSAGGKRLQTFAQVQTNDRGEYRIFDLQPGRYYLEASSSRRTAPIAPQDGRVHSTVPEEGYAVVYYPGVSDVSQASPQDVKPGADWTGADFKLRQLPAYHIRGHVTGATGRGGGRNMVQARPCENTDDMTGTFALPVNQQADARFDVGGAVAGTYCLSVMQPGAGPRGLAVKQMVTVKAGDVDGVELAVPASFSVSGRVIVDGTPPTPMPQIFIGLRTTADQGAAQVAIKSDGTFELDGLYPGAYSIFLPRQSSLYPKSMLYGSQDVISGVIPSLQAGLALTITMGTDPGEVDGTVQPGSVEPGSPMGIAAIPQGAYAARQDMERITTAPAGGNFTLPNLAPGDYKIFALETNDFSDLNNRDLLKLLEGQATAVTVQANEHVQAGVTAISMSAVEEAKGKLK